MRFGNSGCGYGCGSRRTAKTIFSLMFLVLVAYSMVAFHSSREDIDVSVIGAQVGEEKKHAVEGNATLYKDKDKDKDAIPSSEYSLLQEVEKETSDQAAWNSLTPRQQTQIENYRRGKALLLNVHAVHHGGTTFCSRIGRNGIHGGISPSMACLRDITGAMPNRCSISSSSSNTDDSSNEVPFCNSYEEIRTGENMPWTKEETGPFVEVIRPYFHMISWEFSGHKRGIHKHGRSLDDPDWDHPNLVSVVVTRDPLSRFLAHGAHAGRKYDGYNKGPRAMSRKSWWDYAVYDNTRETDNFFLRIVNPHQSDERNKEQENIQNHVEIGLNRTTEEVQELFPTGLNETHFEHGKSFLRNATVVLDIACLTEGIEALGRLLQIEMPPKSSRRSLKHNHSIPYPPPKERIGYDDVYEYLAAKNEWDVALYEYSKTISLVRCKDPPHFEGLSTTVATSTYRPKSSKLKNNKKAKHYRRK